MISDELRAKLRVAATLAITAAACTRKEGPPDAGPIDAASSALVTPAEAGGDGTSAPGDEDASAVATADDASAGDAGPADAAAEAGRKTATAPPPIDTSGIGSIGLIGVGGDGGLGLFGRDPCPGCGMGGQLPRGDLPPGVPDHSTVKGACQLSTVDPKIARGRPRFLACYNSALKSDPFIGGQMLLHLDVAPSGEITKSSVVSSNVPNGGSLEACVRRAGQSLQLDPGAKRSVEVTVAFRHDHG